MRAGIRISLWLLLLAGTPADAAPGAEPKDAAEGLSLALAAETWTGDLDGMIERRRIRVLTPYSRTHYFVDGGMQRGIVHDAMLKLEEQINAKHAKGHIKVHVVFIPTSRDELLPALIEGRGDVVAAGLTITPEREARVDFADPSVANVKEIVVTGPGAPALASLDDLAGQTVFVRTSSSYHASLLALNERFGREGRRPMVLKPAPENLEDEDLLEMVNAGLVKIIVVDDYLAEFWKQVLPDLSLHAELALRSEGRIAPAIRKGSPKLRAELNAALAKYGMRTAFGNQNFQRYLKSTRYVKSATADADRARFLQLIALFRKYGDQYGLDWLLMAAQGYQESRLDQSVKSPVGAIGVMQVMPKTGQELAVGDVRQLEPNVHAGVKYIRFMIDRYYADEPMSDLDKGLFAFASYNAGPARVRQLRAEAARRGLDPNRWFNHVERVAAERIGRETVTYVANIYKYYVAYKLAVEELEQREAEREKLSTGGD
jgi:membrane-bound lytic murein transglycosylase MltF